jgi:hypothetical protein
MLIIFNYILDKQKLFDQRTVRCFRNGCGRIWLRIANPFCYGTVVRKAEGEMATAGKPISFGKDAIPPRFSLVGADALMTSGVEPPSRRGCRS